MDMTIKDKPMPLVDERARREIEQRRRKASIDHAWADGYREGYRAGVKAGVDAASREPEAEA